MRGIAVKDVIAELQKLNPDDVIGIWYCEKQDLEDEVLNSDNNYTMDMLTPHLLKKLWSEVSNDDYVYESLSQSISENLNALLENNNDPDEHKLWEE